MNSRSFFVLLAALACTTPESRDTNAGPASEVVSTESITPSTPDAFAGDWEAVSDDGTSIERAHIDVAGGNAQGILQSLERGYFSGQTRVTAEVSFTGTARDGAIDVAVTAPDGNTTAARAYLRGDYLIVHTDNGESAYARPGTSLIRSAEGSAEAESLARSVTGMIYSTESSASGRGAFVGGRTKLSLCSDGSIAYDKSDLATTGGSDAVDMGSSVSRRGHWDIVLFAGVPAVRAQWQGTGTSYSLTRYFKVQPMRDGSGARIDGIDLGVAGSC